MYKLSVPIMSRLCVDGSREEYLRQFKAAAVDRIFLVEDKNIDLLKENIGFFKQSGFEVGIWIGQTIGHGGNLAVPRVSENGTEFKMLKSTNGTMRGGTACPLDEDFVVYFCNHIKELAKLGADTIMLDDDFRLSQHGGGFCCVCDMHMEKISALCGEELKSEDIMSKVFSGKPNKYRDAWLKVQGESLYSLAKSLRNAVDEVDPKIRIALCVPHCVWDVDGVDPLELTRILAGDNKPLLRLHGAPYWARATAVSLPAVFEMARMFVSFAKDCGFELMPEGDVYPRPRYATPASYLELFDAMIRADGNHGGNYKYMFDYVSSPTYEMGYVKHHIHNLEAQNKISRLFDVGKNIGVRVHQNYGMLKHTDFSFSVPRAKSPYPWDGIMMARCGIPTTYFGEGICDAVFGENARCFDLAQAKNGVIIDGTAAAIFFERGYDVGISSFKGFKTVGVSSEIFCDTKVRVAGENIRFLNADLSENADKLSYVSENGNNIATAYTYQNADGVKFLVYTFDSSSLEEKSEMLCTYARKNQLENTIENFFGRLLPVKFHDSPDLYVLCKEDEKGLSVLLDNCFADSVLDAEIMLGDNYSRAEFVNCDGVIEGKTLKLKSPIGAFSFVAIKLYK